jgi:hypothetical protein
MPRKTPEEREELRRQGQAMQSPDRAAHVAARGKRTSAPPRSLAHLSRSELDDDEFLYAIEAMRKGSDRETAIIGAALIEDVLRSAISAHLERPDDKKALFYDQSAPFHTFKAATVAAYAMGFGTPRLMEDIDRIREIRNQFSHALRPITFKNDDVAAYCAGLDDYEIPEQSGATTAAIQNAKHRFTATCETIWIALSRETTALMKKQIAEMKAKKSELTKAITNALLQSDAEFSR